MFSYIEKELTTSVTDTREKCRVDRIRGCPGVIHLPPAGRFSTRLDSGKRLVLHKRPIALVVIEAFTMVSWKHIISSDLSDAPTVSYFDSG